MGKNMKKGSMRDERTRTDGTKELKYPLLGQNKIHVCLFNDKVGFHWRCLILKFSFHLIHTKD